MPIYDAIIAGAGPAGSTAARLLAQRGAKVLLLDRARFPRDKPCGGGVTVHAATELGIDISPVVERTVRQASISFRLGKPFVRSSASALTYMTQRRRLDAYLVEQAAAAGADFRDGVAVREVKSADGGAIVRSNGEAFHTRTVVGADGANGAVARALGLAPIGEALIALEGNVPASDGLAARWQEAIALDLASPAGGYGWLFPKGDHVNVGVIGWRRTGPQLRGRLSALCLHLGLDERQLQGLRGHHLPLRAPGAAIVRGPGLLAGDAAGLVDPLSGEGIHAAFLSGRLAAGQIASYLSGASPDLSEYQVAIDRELMPVINFSRTLQAVFHLMPRPWISLLRHGDWLWRNTCRLVRGEATYADFRRKAGPLSFAFDAAGRLAARRSVRETPS